MGPENSLDKHRRRVRLTMEELNSRTVPALLDGVDADSLGDVEQIAITKDEWADVELTAVTDEFATDVVLDESAWAEFSITAIDESAYDFTGEWVEDEVPVFKGDDGFERPIMPFYRTLELKSEDIPVEEIALAEGEFDVTTFDVVSEEVPADWLFASFSGVADDTLTEEFTEPDFSVVDPIPEEWVFYTMRGDEGSSEEIPVDDLMFYTFGAPMGGEEYPVALADGGEEYFDPAICYMAIDPVIDEEPVAVATTAVVEETTTDDSDAVGLLSAFSPDDFANFAVEETEELELTAEVATTEPIAAIPTTPTVAPDSEAEQLTYFSIDGSLLDFYLSDDLDETL